MPRLSLDARRNLLFVMTALVVCYVRHIVQYGYRPWAEGLVSFLGNWLIHYIAVGIVFVMVLAISLKTDPFFFPDRPAKSSDERIEDTMVHVCITLIAASLFVWFVHFWPGSGDSYE